MKDKFQSTPCYGYFPAYRSQFNDSEQFGAELWKYVILSKVTLWYGTPKSGDDNLKEKIVLGIKCVYTDTMTGKKTTSHSHCGDITKEDVEKKELELVDNDFINKFYIGADNAVTHIKLITKNGQVIEVGNENVENKKTVELNLSTDIQMVQSFFGCYDLYGLRALGCKYISKKDFIFFNLMGILRLRHIFKTNKEERKKWENPEELEKLNYKMQTVARLCALPDNTFSGVIKFCAL